ncbi:FecR domain-containing protein [Sphingomonas donggukensis]|uniref:FecR domain-containing protein n=1 Tax=Sphingomonas donggukensis TaxID=2949093 RepID=A0ABY4TU18_9SPHN|nr:FecR domain-containing protein [Sphingomonas donggukensis]URW75887.1 FecR domain-containing protein [Sphingomonas donggukensis]
MIPRARRQALDWDDRLKRDRSPETRAEFEAWLAADAANRAEYAQISALDTLMAEGKFRSTRPAPRESRRLWPALATAAAVGAVAVVALVGSPFSNRLGGPSLTSSAEAQLTRPIRLEDGTLVILSAQARAEPRFSTERRQVTLRDGSARFLVARDPARPLVVVAGKVRATATEGVFDVDAVAAGGRVTARRGSVAVEPRDGGQTSPTQTVAALQSIDVATMTVSPAPQRERVTVIEADGLALDDVIRIANDGGGVPLAVASQALGARRVTGRFDLSDHRVLARRLAAALGLGSNDEGGRLLLAPP